MSGFEQFLLRGNVVDLAGRRGCGRGLRHGGYSFCKRSSYPADRHWRLDHDFFFSKRKLRRGLNKCAQASACARPS